MPVHMTYGPARPQGAPSVPAPPPHTPQTWKAARVTLCETSNLGTCRVPKGAIVFELETPLCCHDENGRISGPLDDDKDLFVIVEPL